MRTKKRRPKKSSSCRNGREQSCIELKSFRDKCFISCRSLPEEEKWPILVK
jgi:hypothetical protein